LTSQALSLQSSSQPDPSYLFGIACHLHPSPLLAIQTRQPELSSVPPPRAELPKQVNSCNAQVVLPIPSCLHSPNTQNIQHGRQGVRGTRQPLLLVLLQSC
ncbi:uncharacterized protein THITE_66688, partial [Thermothielavioides terrestris NRRL 8126]